MCSAGSFWSTWSNIIKHKLQKVMSLVEPPPEACPGTGTEESGKVKLSSCFKNSFLPTAAKSLSALIVRFTLQAAACEGCPNQSICASAGPAAPDPDVELIARNLDGVKNIVLVLSGKVNSYFKT